MLKKQDRQGVRRPADIEQKYNFNKQFSEARKVAEEARRIATDITETDKGLSLKVEAIGKDVENVKAELELKVETDENGNLKSEVHVTGNEFTVDTDNFKLDKNGNVGITGAFNTKSSDGRFSTSIDGGIILVKADSYYVGVGDGGKMLYGHQIIRFKGLDNTDYALVAYGEYITSTETGERTFEYKGVMVEKVD